MRLAALVSAALVAGGPLPALALGGGGTAPGGPLSGSIRPACNGYNMDGTPNTSPGAREAGCVDRSARSTHRAASAPRVR